MTFAKRQYLMNGIAFFWTFGVEPRPNGRGKSNGKLVKRTTVTACDTHEMHHFRLLTTYRTAKVNEKGRDSILSTTDIGRPRC